MNNRAYLWLAAAALVCSACSDPTASVTGDSVVELYPYESGDVLLGDETGELDCGLTSSARKGTGGAVEIYRITVSCAPKFEANINIPYDVDDDAPNVTVHAGASDRHEVPDRWRRRCIKAGPDPSAARTTHTTVLERVDDIGQNDPRVIEGVIHYWGWHNCFKGRLDFRLEVR